MSYEKFGSAYTAEDLFQFLKEIPAPIREVLPLILVIDDEIEFDSEVGIEAYEVRETEGCLERGFRLTQTEQ